MDYWTTGNKQFYVNLPSVLLILVLGLAGVVGTAQPFDQLSSFSKKKVKEVIEWRADHSGKEAEKIGHSFFDQKGQLMKYQGGDVNPIRQIYSYDDQGRVVEVRTVADDREQATFYAYPKGQKVEHTTYRKKHYKTYWYYEGKKIKEEKVFAKGEELGATFQLKERRLYHYNKKDSLTSETHFLYSINGKGDALKRKVFHHYDAKSGKRKRSVYHDTDGSIRTTVSYEYDKKGRIQVLEESFQDGRPPHRLTFLYQGKYLWQKIDDYGYEKAIRIYREGLLIRTRSYVGGKLFSLVDYQYKYYP